MSNPTTSVESPALTEIVRAVLLVARLGEADRRGWWGTGSFGAAGRVVLKGRLPLTWRMAAAELDVAAARNRHNEVIERRNAVHLFSDNWPVRRWASAWVAEQKTADPADEFLEALETIATEEIVDRLRTGGATTPASGQALRVGAVSSTDFASPEALLPAVGSLAAAYVDLTSFAVPYLEVVE